MNGVHGGITLVLRARSAGRHYQGQAQGAAADGTVRTPCSMRLGYQDCLAAVGIEGMLSGCPEEVLRSVVSSRAPTGI